MKRKGIKLNKDGAHVATSVNVLYFQGQPQKDGKPIYPDDFPGLTSLNSDPTDLTVTHTESDEDEGSLHIWKEVKGTRLEFRLCVQCQRHYVALAGKKTSTCGTNCRRRWARLHEQNKHAKQMAIAEEFVCGICQHECGNQPALDNHIRLKHPVLP